MAKRRRFGKAWPKRAPRVMTGLGPVTHDFTSWIASKSWLAGPRPAITRGARAAVARCQAAKAGRFERKSVAFSNASATWNTFASWNGLPTICIDTGSPAGPKPEHTAIAG